MTESERSESNANATTTTPIYSSYLTLGTFLDWLKAMPVMPSHVDRSLWSTKFSGTGGAQLIAGLRFLALLDGDRPTPRLAALVAADTFQRKELLRATLRDSYGDSLIANLPSMTPRVFDERLRALGTTDSTHRKAASFFINAAKAIDIALPAAIAKKARNRPTVGPRRNGRTRQKPIITTEAQPADQSVRDRSKDAGASANRRTITLRGGGGEVTLLITVDLLGLRGPDREFVFGLIDTLDAYEHPESGQGA